LNLDPSTPGIVYLGDPVTFNWDTAWAVTGEINPGNHTVIIPSVGYINYPYDSMSGSLTFVPTASTNTMTVQNGGSDVASCSVNVNLLLQTPTSLNAVYDTANKKVDLAWTDNSSAETNFVIERKIGTGSWATLATVGVNVTTYSDTAVSFGETYSYRVQATAGVIVSNYSNVAIVTLPAGVCLDGHKDMIGSTCSSDPDCEVGSSDCQPAAGGPTGYCKKGDKSGYYPLCSEHGDCQGVYGGACGTFTCFDGSNAGNVCNPNAGVSNNTYCQAGSGKGWCQYSGNISYTATCVDGAQSKIGNSCIYDGDCSAIGTGDCQ